MKAKNGEAWTNSFVRGRFWPAGGKMHSLYLWTALALAAPPLEDGSLLFLENCNSVVEFSTKSEVAHVALAFNDADGCFVYEATPGEVRRISFAEYLVELGRINHRRDADSQVRVWLFRPTPGYSEPEVAAMRAALAAQIGRRYSVRNYVRKKSGDGIHCAELAALVLNASGRFTLQNGAKIHPAELHTTITGSEHYGPAEELAIAPLATTESWCVRAQRRTAEWFTWCGWSCQEAWLWCW
jgi:hypothetical protein